MIDYHCHLLPALDDGPKDIEESLAMAATLLKAGFRKIYCTPHLMKGFHDADNQAVLSAVITMQKRLNAENIKVEILPGREYYLDEFLGSYLKHPLPLGKTKYIMIEIPNYAPERFVKEACFRIKCGGFIPMIAHPERCQLFAFHQKRKTSLFDFSGSKNKTSEVAAKKTGLINYLQDIGCAFQGNIGSFNALYGPDVQQTANDLKKNKVFTHFGTDAHSLQGVISLNFKIKSKP
jgi:protein-tyrosine phosphatase